LTKKLKCGIILFVENKPRALNVFGSWLIHPLLCIIAVAEHIKGLLKKLYGKKKKE